MSFQPAQDGTGDEIDTEGGEDREVEETGRGHDGRVLPLPGAWPAVTTTSPIVVIAHATHIHPRIPF